MGFLRKLLDSFGNVSGQIEKKGLSTSTEAEVAPIQTEHDESECPLQDKRLAVCPYCQGALKKIPGSKTKCPHCNKHMFIRTNTDNIKMVVTEEEAEKIDEDWAMKSGTYDLLASNKEEFEVEREALRKQFGKEPSANDVRWRILNKDLMKNAMNMDFGLYRNTRLHMGELLYKEGKFKDALATYLEASYLDLNGPNNAGGIKDDPEILKDYPVFNSKQGFLAPGLIKMTLIAIKRLGFNKSEVEDIFLKIGSRVYKSLKLPVKPETCWEIIWESLEKAK